MITINLEKAKNIKKNILRAEREPLLLSLDIQFQRAMETNSDTSAIVAKKQRLRDITYLVNNCKTIEELELINIEAGL